MRIALIEDNEALAQGIAHHLRDQGHAVDLIHDGAAGLEFLRQEQIDLLVLDVNLPGQNGFEIVKSLRSDRNPLPIILLTARSDLEDRLQGLDAGADDYLIKPFEMQELVARIRALLRRKPLAQDRVIALGQLQFDQDGRRLFSRAGEIDLPRRELSVFECLLDRSGRIVSKAQLADHLYGTGAEVDEKVVETYVSRLRKKLTPYGLSIKTARGLGYMLDNPA